MGMTSRRVFGESLASLQAGWRVRWFPLLVLFGAGVVGASIALSGIVTVALVFDNSTHAGVVWAVLFSAFGLGALLFWAAAQPIGLAWAAAVHAETRGEPADWSMSACPRWVPQGLALLGIQLVAFMAGVAVCGVGVPIAGALLFYAPAALVVRQQGVFDAVDASVRRCWAAPWDTLVLLAGTGFITALIANVPLVGPPLSMLLWFEVPTRAWAPVDDRWAGGAVSRGPSGLP
jgi:hypothetical protein